MRTLTKLLLLLLLCGIAGTVCAGTTTYRVGPGCTYSTIQDAIDAIPNNGEGIIRIRSGTYTENLTIINKTIDLLGGHADCATTTATGTTNVDGIANTSSVISFWAIHANHSLLTARLNLYNGTGNLLSPAGGLNILANTGREVFVNLDQTTVQFNASAHRGGGIAMLGEGTITLVMMNNSRLHYNVVTGETPHGGGLYCQGDHGILMFGGSIANNTAGIPTDDIARGGGIFLDGCEMSWFANAQTTSVDDASLRNNIVYGGGALDGGHGGGGLYATGGAVAHFIGAHFVLFGDPASSRPLRIHDNQAQGMSGDEHIGSGSAVFASGSGTRVTLDRTWVYNNQVGRHGTLYALGGAEIMVERASEVCHTPRACSRIFNNSSAFSAVAMSHGIDSLVRLRRTIVSGNGADHPNATYLFENQFGGTIQIEDSLIHGNSSSWGFYIFQDYAPTLRIERTTIADNDFSALYGTVFRITGDDTVFRLYDSIVHQPGTPIANDFESFWTPIIHVDCVIWHEHGLDGTRTLVADPLFADPDQHLYYLQPGSPAINYCDIPPPSPGVDLDWNPRGICHSTDEDCGIELYDLGAYEMPLMIFSDRFED